MTTSNEETEHLLNFSAERYSGYTGHSGKLSLEFRGQGHAQKDFSRVTLADTVTDPKKCLIMSYYTAVDTNKQSCQQFS